MPRTALETPLRRAISYSPGSIRSLARQVGVQPSTLTRILSGERSATPTVAAGVAVALREWAEACSGLAERLEAELGGR